MTTADALLAAVIASPDDDLPRLVFADWLDENGDPDRAEFIRLQIAHARGTLDLGGLVREKVLLQTHTAVWLAPMWAGGGALSTRRTHGVFRRGFVDAVWMPAGWFVLYGDRLFAVAPVTELRVIFDHPGLEYSQFTESPHLARLRALDVCDHRFGAKGVEDLFHFSCWQGLRVLRLPGCNIDEQAAESLCATSLRLDALDLQYNPLTDAAKQRLRDRFGTAVVFD